MSLFWEAVGGGFLGSILGVFGSEIGGRVFEPRARRESRRDHQLEICQTHLDKIGADAADYWGGKFEAHSREVIAAEAMIVANLHSLASETADLFQGDLETVEFCEQDIRRLRQLITGSTFGDEQPNIDKRRLRDIAASIADLRRALEKRRHKQKRSMF